MMLHDLYGICAIPSCSSSVDITVSGLAVTDRDHCLYFCSISHLIDYCNRYNEILQASLACENTNLIRDLGYRYRKETP